MRNSNAFAVFMRDHTLSALKGSGRFFWSTNMDAETFSDSEKFLRYARIHPPTIALVDVCTPLLSGLEIQFQLREISPSTRLIILTRRNDRFVRISAISAAKWNTMLDRR
jgi:FixJ family two-component response regulator